MLQAKDLSVSKNGFAVLQNVSIAVERGEIAVVVGPSGAGKSTLIRSLAFLEAPSSGEISFERGTFLFPAANNGKHAPVSPWPEITVVFQDLFLWPHMSLRRNILYPVEKAGGRDPHRRKETEAQLQQFLDLFGMNDFIDRYPAQVSGGEKQRAAIVRALMLRPKYVLLDEITSALDVEQIEKIARTLIGLANQGIGVLLVTHLINFARHAASKVHFLDGGRIEESGDKSILSSPRSARLRHFLDAFELAS